MGRIHLFEFEDLPWFPGFLRNYGTDFLQFLSNNTGMYNTVIPLLEEALRRGNTQHIIDLGSGGGGGLLWLNSELRKSVPDLKITLTDFYPNIPAFEYTSSRAENIELSPEPVDARQVPAGIKGLRTQFLSLHHFKPGDARQILQNAVDSGSPIAIIEGQERSFMSILALAFSPISVLLTTPLIRPFKVGRIFFTYLLPIVPLFVMWDGIVSSLRTYSVPEMQELIDGLQNNNTFDWELGRLKSGPVAVLYLLGTPRSNETSAQAS